MNSPKKQRVSGNIYKDLISIIVYGDKMSNEPDIKYDLERENDEFSHWLELYLYYDGGEDVERVKVVKQDSKPVFNESTYYFKRTDKRFECRSGKKSCSTGSRDTSASDEVVDLVNTLVKEFEDGGEK